MATEGETAKKYKHELLKHVCNTHIRSVRPSKFELEVLALPPPPSDSFDFLEKNHNTVA